MSETNAPEPTMEEILASIRRIISEDEPAASAPADAAAPAGDPPRPPEPAATPTPAPAAAPAPEPRHEEVLELTDRFEPEPPAAPPAAPSTPALGDLDFSSPAPAPAMQAPRPAPAPPARPAPAPAAFSAPVHDEPLVSASNADRAADHFSTLSSSLAMPASGRTLEDVTRELLRPLLKEWLDQNLARIVEERVQDEVERISRRRPS